MAEPHRRRDRISVGVVNPVSVAEHGQTYLLSVAGRERARAKEQQKGWRRHNLASHAIALLADQIYI